MKKLFNTVIFIYAFICFVPVLSFPVTAENISHSVLEMRLTDILVSALYFIGVLLLIYFVLTLVSRWGKKHPEENTEEEKEEKNAERETETSAPESQSAKAEKEEKGKKE